MSESKETIINRQEIYDGTSLDIYNLCPRKYYYAREWDMSSIIGENNGGNCGIVPLKEDMPLTYGGAIHQALDVYYSGGKKHEAIEAFVKKCQEPGSQIPLKISNDCDYSIEYGIYLMSYYFDVYPLENEPFTIIRGTDGKPYVEVGFAAAFPTGIYYGKIDIIAREKHTNNIYPVEHKHTMKQINEAYWRRYRVNNQISRYMWVIWQMLGEMPKGTIINAIRAYPFKRDDKKTSLKDKVFLRTVTRRSAAQLNDAGRQIEWQMALIEKSREYGVSAFYQNAPVACNAWFKECEYSPLCQTSSNILRQSIIRGNFKEQSWQPYNVEESMKEELGRSSQLVELTIEKK
jgi:hypothetical protein